MIKVFSNNGNVKCKAEGDVVELATDIMCVIHSMCEELKAADEECAKMLRFAMVEAIQDDDSCDFNGEEDDDEEE